MQTRDFELKASRISDSHEVGTIPNYLDLHKNRKWRVNKRTSMDADGKREANKLFVSFVSSWMVLAKVIARARWRVDCVPSLYGT